jgi:cold shock CspA family protein
MRDEQRVTGVVSRWIEARGFGFIDLPSGPTFIHASDVIDPAGRLAEGVLVAFDVESTQRGLRARRIEIVG